MTIQPNPCPFCGSSEIIVQKGTTFRWMVAVCTQCGAVGPEVRVQTCGSGDWYDWKIKGKTDAILEWNERKQAEPPK